MTTKIKKSFWSKLTKLDEVDLLKSGQKIEIKKNKTEKKSSQIEELSQKYTNEKLWLPAAAEGKLAIDVYFDETNIIVISAIAGVKAENLEIIVDRDILTIKGTREKPKEIDKNNYLHQECFWGSFSRTILLPCEVKIDEIKANLKNGILTIILPAQQKTQNKIKISPETNERKIK